jgi:hypothetical protein
MSIVDPLALQIVRGDEVEPQVAHLERLREQGEPAAEAVDGDAGL